MRLFFTSDTHFNHFNICNYSNRPFSSVEEMNDTLIQNWNKVVTRDDLVYHLGDICLGLKVTMRSLISQLNGKIRLIKGNHEGAAAACPDLFEWIKDYFEMPTIVNGKNQYIVMCHYAFRVWNHSHHGSWNLFGHSHNTLERLPYQFDVGVDSVAKYLANKANRKVIPEDYRPIELKELVDVFKNDIYVPVDHHNSGVN